MEQSLRDHRPSTYFPGNNSPSFQLAKETETDRLKQELAFDDSVNVAGDWLEATEGMDITEEEYRRLYEAGYASYPPDYIKGIFYDWEDYQKVSQTFYADRQRARMAKEDELLEALQQERELGLLPEAIFKDQVLSYEQDSNGRPRLARYELTEDEAPALLVIKRYYKYLLVDYLTRDRPDQDALSDDRKLNISLGFTLQPGKPGKALSSFIGSLKNSNSLLHNEDIIQAAEEIGAYDYVFPKSRKRHLGELIKVAQPENTDPEREEKDNLPSAKAYFDTEKGELIVGADARRRYLEENPEAKETVKKLGRLLLAETVEQKFGRRGAFREWQKEDCIRYGRWLLKVLKPYKDTITRVVLNKGYVLGIGPHPDKIGRLTGTVVDYFQELSELEKVYVGGNRRGMFEDWQFDDYVDYIKNVASENDGVVTKKILFERIGQGAREPSPHMIEKRFGLNTLLEAAGLPAFSKSYSAEDCIEAGLRFARENNGKTPSEVDMKRTSYLMSDYLVRKYFGKVSTYREVVQRQLEAGSQPEPSGYEFGGEELLAA